MKRIQVCIEQHGITSVFDPTHISVGSPRKLFVFIIRINPFRVKICNIHLSNFEHKITGHRMLYYRGSNLWQAGICGIQLSILASDRQVHCVFRKIPNFLTIFVVLPAFTNDYARASGIADLVIFKPEDPALHCAQATQVITNGLRFASIPL